MGSVFLLGCGASDLSTEACGYGDFGFTKIFPVFLGLHCFDGEDLFQRELYHKTTKIFNYFFECLNSKIIIKK